jgi:hypothetical protein
MMTIQKMWICDAYVASLETGAYEQAGGVYMEASNMAQALADTTTEPGTKAMVTKKAQDLKASALQLACRLV